MAPRAGVGAALLLLLVMGAAAAAKDSVAVPALTPAPGPAEAIGSPANGCLAGAEALPPQGPGWEVLRPQRNRYWGHPALIAFLERIAGRLRGQGDLLIGDIGQPRGGPMASGHASHQIGLDVDVLFRLAARPLDAAERQHPVFEDMVEADGKVDMRRWGARQVRMLAAFAADPGVERIFVNSAIKRRLCETVRTKRGWLRKIRPWWGHVAHFHVRLACPPDQPYCRPRQPLPPGDGCDASLAWWFTPEAKTPAPRVGPKPPLPNACRAILGAPG